MSKTSLLKFGLARFHNETSTNFPCGAHVVHEAKILSENLKESSRSVAFIDQNKYCTNQPKSSVTSHFLILL